VGDQTIERLCADEQNLPDTPVLEEAIREDMARVFPAALLGRLQIVPYYPLGREALYRIIDLKLGKIKKRVTENYAASLVIADAVKDEIIRRCDNAASGARLIDAVINNSLLPEVSAEFLRSTLEAKQFGKVLIDAKDQAFTYSFENKEAK
jgi:type VI secretion system protein VasG